MMGILTNIYIAVVIWLVGAGSVILSPVIGTILFIAFFVLLKRDILDSKTVYFGISAIVIAEITIHTHFLGWDCGFYYYAFLIPMVFLLNSSWKILTTVLFNSSILVYVIVLRYFYEGVPGICEVPESGLSAVKFINLGGTAFIVVVIMTYFSRTLNRKDEELIQANAALEIQNKEITAQHEHKQILLKEIHHRVKNNLQIISSLISLQLRTVDDEQIVTVLDESRRRVEAIALIHQKLYQDENITRVNFKFYLRDILRSQQEMNPEVQCVLESEDVVLSLDIAVPLGLVVSELISNAFKHAFTGVEHPKLSINLLDEGNDHYILSVQDNGIGLPCDFDLKSDKSLGTEIIDALTSQINAQVEFFNEKGAVFRIFFNDK